MGNIVKQPGLGRANGGGTMPEWWGDNHGSGSFFTDDDRPCLACFLVVDSDLQVSDEPHPEIGLEGVAMPGFDDAGVLHGEVDLPLRAHHALELIHQRPSPIVRVVRGWYKDRCVLGFGDFVGFCQWDAQALGLVYVHWLYLVLC